MGGSDLYEFVNNQPTDYRDYLGLITPECLAAMVVADDAYEIYEMDPNPRTLKNWKDLVAKAIEICKGPPLLPPIPPPPVCPPPLSPIIPPPGPVQKCGWVLVGAGLGGVLDYAWVCVFAL
jgi:hypothetical protein